MSEALQAAHTLRLEDAPTVHGDVRAGNIMIRADLQPHEGSAGCGLRFIDFDFAGREGVATYPLLLAGPPHVPRPEGAVAGAPLKQAHDIGMVPLLFSIR